MFGLAAGQQPPAFQRTRSQSKLPGPGATRKRHRSREAHGTGQGSWRSGRGGHGPAGSSQPGMTGGEGAVCCTAMGAAARHGARRDAGQGALGARQSGPPGAIPMSLLRGTARHHPPCTRIPMSLLHGSAECHVQQTCVASPRGTQCPAWWHPVGHGPCSTLPTRAPACNPDSSAGRWSWASALHPHGPHQCQSPRQRP